MRTLFDGIPLGQVTTSMTINSTAAILLSMYLAVAEEQGTPWGNVGGTVQNDILKEYIARGTHIYPPPHSLRLVTDLIVFCSEHVPRWNPVSISGYHIREAGSTAAQEIAFTLANALCYVDLVLARGLEIDSFAPRLSFFFNAHNNFLEEVAKFRAARRLWAELVRERYEPRNERSCWLRFHTQTGGSTLTAQQPENNVARVAIQALAAVCGGTQSLHTNGADEALGLPTETSARVALRSQQIVAHETGVADVADPLGGSWAIEALTEELAAKARSMIEQIEELGGAARAIESGLPAERDRERRLPSPVGGRIQGRGDRRRQRLHPGRRRGGHLPGRRPGRRSPAGRAGAEGPRATRLGRDDRGPRPAPAGGGGRRQPRSPHPRLRPAAGHPGRDLGPPAHRLGRVRTVSR